MYLDTKPRLLDTLFNNVSNTKCELIMKDIKSDMVVKSNTLIEASYNLTNSEHRLLDLALAELSTYDECEKQITTLPETVYVRAEVYSKVFGVSKDAAYLALREASEQLFTRYFTYRVKSEIYPTHKEFRKARWVQEIGYIEGQGVVVLSFTKTLTELAGRLSREFSRYHLEQTAPLRSAYARRLYEMMMQWRGDHKEVPYLSYYELRHRFCIEEKQYSTMSNFKRVVLDPAIKQINKYTDIDVSYENKLEGRKIVGFVFKTKMKKPPKPPIKDAKKIASSDNPKAYTIDGLSDAQLSRITRNPKFCQDFGHLVSPSSNLNTDMNAWSVEFVKRIKENHEQFNIKRPIRTYLDY
jgi:plasmid replication initiation protein